MKVITLFVLISWVYAARTIRQPWFRKTGQKLKICCPQKSVSYNEAWGYVNVREGAHMFWWLYSVSTTKQESTNRPLVLWLQGGPGSSGVGFGNFDELGPLDADLKPRNTTWLQKADLLFIDNPVGTGFSYVDTDDLLTTNVQGISADLLSFFQKFFGTLHPEYKGIALGDSWISAIDYVENWGPYLYGTSWIDQQGLNKTQTTAIRCSNLVEMGKWTEAEMCWSEMETIIGSLTNQVSWYNILKRGNSDPWSKFEELEYIDRLGKVHNSFGENLAALMNGVIKKKLKIIPDNVQWGGQAGKVFAKQAGDFMKPVIESVDYLLANSTIKVVVFNGQLDLICATPGTLAWINKLKWPGLANFRQATRTAFSLPKDYQTAGFVKKFKNFQFYWIMRAGHMVAHDAADAALLMLEKIIQ